MITCAAIWTEEKVYSGASHAAIRFSYMSELGSQECVEGFLTDDDIFLNRQEAAKEAFACKQLSNPVDTLFSYQIWR